MKQKIYAVHDIKAEIFNLPYFAVNDATAIRSFAGGVKDPTTDLYRNPEDYSLHYLGEYDMESGTVVGDGPKVIALAAQFGEN